MAGGLEDTVVTLLDVRAQGGSFEPTFELRTLKTQPHDEEQVTS